MGELQEERQLTRFAFKIETLNDRNNKPTQVTTGSSVGLILGSLCCEHGKTRWPEGWSRINSREQGLVGARRGLGKGEANREGQGYIGVG